MLYIVLALVLGAFGLLIAALTTANTLWAWISVVVSVVAAALLVSDWVNGRRKSRADDKDAAMGGVRHRRDVPDDLVPDDEDDLLEDEDVFAPEFPPEPVPKADLDFDIAPISATGPDAVRTVVTEAVAEPSADDRAETSITPVQEDFGGEPGEEPTDASDLLVVAGLSAEVRVVDEHPRYHLATCVWLANRPTIPIPISEARQLGFTPCARCGPDATLAARHRARAN